MSELAKGTVMIPVPAFAIGIVVLFVLVYGLLSLLDRIPMRRLYPPDPYREPLPDHERRLLLRGDVERPPHVDLDRIPPARSIRAAGREIARRQEHDN